MQLANWPHAIRSRTGGSRAAGCSWACRKGLGPKPRAPNARKPPPNTFPPRSPSRFNWQRQPMAGWLPFLFFFPFFFFALFIPLLAFHSTSSGDPEIRQRHSRCTRGESQRHLAWCGCPRVPVTSTRARHPPCPLPSSLFPHVPSTVKPPLAQIRRQTRDSIQFPAVGLLPLLARTRLLPSVPQMLHQNKKAQEGKFNLCSCEMNRFCIKLQVAKR